MRPGNLVCDALHIDDEHERGMMRMLVNMMIVGSVAFGSLFAAWLWIV
jgi:hypothetical protein